MTPNRIAFVACSALLLMGCASAGSTAAEQRAGRKVANPITGEGLPNPAPKVTRNWGQLPAGRQVGHYGWYRYRPEGRERLGLRAVRRWRSLGWRSRLRHNAGRSGIQVRPQDRRGARELRQGPHGDAARYSRRCARERVDRGLRRQQGRHEGASGTQVQPAGREAHELRRSREARHRRRTVRTT